MVYPGPGYFDPDNEQTGGMPWHAGAQPPALPPYELEPGYDDGQGYYDDEGLPPNGGRPYPPQSPYATGQYALPGPPPRHERLALPPPPRVRAHQGPPPPRTDPQRRHFGGGHVPGGGRFGGHPRGPGGPGGKGFRRLFAICALALIAIPGVLFAANGMNGLKWGLGVLGIHVPHPHSPFKTTTTDNVIGNVILEQVSGVSKPALSEADYAFDIERKRDMSFLLFKCWYAQDFHAEARASAYVNFNPGAAWWAKGTGHYQMVRNGTQVTVNLVLPEPTVPSSVHQVVIDNTTSKPLGAPMHSFSYPGPGCGTGPRNPHFSNEDFFPIAQKIAYGIAVNQPVKIDGVTMINSTNPGVIRTRMITSAENEAHSMYVTDFIGPTVAARGDHLVAVNIRWVPQSPN